MNQLTLEVAYASAVRQVVVPLTVTVGTSIASAISASGIMQEFPEIVLDPQAVGIFGQKRELSDLVTDGDRIEIYRPLTIEPKQRRRLLAAATKK